MKKLTFFLNEYHKYVLFSLIILFLFIRLIQLDELFVGLHIDETGIMYDAYTLAYFNVDRYLNSFPVYMINFGGGQSALYTYLAAILFRLFSPSVFWLRIPIVISNLMLCTSVYILVKKSISKNWALFSFVFMMLIPFSMMYTRFALDCNLFVGFLSAFVVLFDYALDKQENKWFVFCGVFLGITLYTYILSWMLLPLVLLATMIYLVYVKKVNIKQMMFMLIPAFIMALPLFGVLIVNIFGLESIEITYFTISKMFFWRQGEISLNNVFDNFNFLWSALTYDAFDYNSNALFGTIYYTMIPCFFVGLFVICKETIKSIKDKKYSIFTMISIIFIANYILNLMIADPNVSKANSWYFSIGYITVFGLRYLYQKYEKIGILFLTSFAVSSLLFMAVFYSDSSKDLNYLFKDGIGELITHYQHKYPNMDIYIESYDEKPYAWYIADTLPDPYSIDYRNYIAPNVNFYLPDENSGNSVFILLEDYERITALYQEYEKDPTKISLEAFGEYQVYIKW